MQDETVTSAKSFIYLLIFMHSLFKLCTTGGKRNFG